MRNKLSLVVLLVLCSATRVVAHSDTLFTIEADGTIKGLPARYQPASYSKGAHILRIGNNVAEFPSCFVDKFFPLDSTEEVSLSGSWYHERSSLPPYLNFMVSIPGRPYRFEILFELDTLKIIDASFSDQIRTGNSIQVLRHKLELEESCRNEYHLAIKRR